MLRTEYRYCYRQIRTLMSKREVVEIKHQDGRALDAAIRALFWRREHQGSVECCKAAPNFERAKRLNLDAARFRRWTGWAQEQAARKRLG